MPNILAFIVCSIPDRVSWILIPLIHDLLVLILIKILWYLLDDWISCPTYFQKNVKAFDKGSDCFKLICQNIKKSQAKLTNGVFAGPEIRFLMKHDGFPGTMTDLQCIAWFNFYAVARHVLGKNVTKCWKQKVDLLMSNFQAMGCPSVSNKMNLPFKHKDKCEPYLRIFSDKCGERLHKEMQVVKKCFSHCLNKEMLAECIW